MRLVPVVAVVSEDTLDALAPAVEAAEELLRTDAQWRELAAQSGWTAEALAYGTLLSRVAYKAEGTG